MAKTRKQTNVVKMTREAKQVEGDHVHIAVPPPALKSYLVEILRVKSTTSELGQELTTATKRFAEAGGNAPAARIVGRLVSKAKSDPVKARVLWEDVLGYMEIANFDQLAPKLMFSAEESGQRLHSVEEAGDHAAI